MSIVLALAILAQGKIEWRDGADHDAALVEARLTGTPVMLYFCADW